MAKILIFTATYNESDNIAALVREISEAVPEADVLVIDDASPDGTGALLDRLAEGNPRLQAIHRPRKAGLGSAHMLAMKRAIAGGYDYVFTMDADFSHHPKYLPQLIEQLDLGQDFVIGSRYVKGGRCDYGFLRQLLSRGANGLAISLLGIPLKETTTSYRGFRVEMLRQLDLDRIRSTGYSFFVEFVYRIAKCTKRMSEVPIHFEDRRAGSSKISKIEIFKGVVAVFRLAYDRLLRLAGLRTPSGARITSASPAEAAPTQPCPVCAFNDHTVMFPSTTITGHDGARYQCTNTHHASHGQIVRCLGCGLISTNPQLPAEEIQSLYADVEDSIYLENVEARRKTFGYNLRKIKDVLPTRGRLLDVGAYCGVFMQTAREECGYEVSGVEPSRWAVAYSKEHGMDVHCGTLSSLPAERRDLDVITAWDVLEHVSDPMTELALVNTRLRTGGIYAFSTLNVNNWFPKLVGERWPWYMDMHLYYFTNDVLKHMLEQNGFELIRTQAYCHIITGEYFLRKVESLGLPAASLLRKGPIGRLLQKIYIPFRFGDIQLFVARKIRPAFDGSIESEDFDGRPAIREEAESLVN